MSIELALSKGVPVSEDNESFDNDNTFLNFVKNRRVDDMYNVIDDDWAIEVGTLNESSFPNDIKEDAGLWHFHGAEGSVTIDCIYVRNVPSSFDKSEQVRPVKEEPPKVCPFCSAEIPEHVKQTYLFAVTTLGF